MHDREVAERKVDIISKKLDDLVNQFAAIIGNNSYLDILHILLCNLETKIFISKFHKEFPIYYVFICKFFKLVVRIRKRIRRENTLA